MTDVAPPPPPVPPSTWTPLPGGDPDPTRTGPAWEQPDGSWFRRFAQTTQALLTAPGDFFRTMRREGGLGEPIGYGVIGSVAGGLVGAVYQLLLSTTMAGLQGPAAAREQALAGLFSTGCIIVIMPIASVIGMFIGSAVYHVMLLLLGGARRPYETTLRVAAYSNGGTAVLNLIPLCGSIAAAVYAIVVAIIGLSRAHEISTGKAAAAVLLPVLICCVLVVLFYGALAALFLGAIMSGASR
jgi:hypothetical protein